MEVERTVSDLGIKERRSLGWRWKGPSRKIRLGPGYIFLFSREALAGLEVERSVSEDPSRIEGEKEFPKALDE